MRSKDLPDSIADIPDSTSNNLIHLLFEEQAKIHPAKVAIVFEGGELTYTELDSKSNKLANYLCSHGVKNDSLVGLCFPRSLDMLVGILGILKAGAAYIAIDPDTPQDRLDYILSDSRPELILTTSGVQQKFLNHKRKIIYDLESGKISAEGNATVQVDISPSNLAYVIYTSGSTGYPKGVMIEHGSVVNLIRSMQKVPGLTSADTMLSINSIAFDVAAMEIFLPLSVGATIHMVGRDRIVNASRLREAMDDNISFVQTTASTWRMLLEAGWKGNSEIRIISTGEPLDLPLAKLLLGNCKELWDFYGPTETTVYSTGCRILPEDEEISIGYPVDNTEVYILDEDLRPVKHGEAGELHIGGAGLARGYLNKSELTSKKFIVNPFSPQNGSRLYKTGDLVSEMPDGKIRYIGRSDFQVKINGYRIELSEIEHTLLRYPGIHQSVVTTVPSSVGHIQLAAYIVLSQKIIDANFSGKGLIQEVQNFCRRKLPAYMVPAYFVLVEKIPVNLSGKIDRSALPLPNSSHVPVNITREIILPRTETEKLLAEIWRDILHINEISITDNFFELGGDSLLGVRMVGSANTAGLKFSINHFFVHQTIQELAATISNSAIKSGSYIIPINTSGKASPLFCFPAGSGNYKEYKTIFSYIGTDHPVYYFLPNGAHKSETPFTSIESLACEYVNDIMKLQQEGTFFLTGFSFGGALALEVAQQLKRRGYKIGALIIIDTYIPGSYYPDTLRNAGIRRKIGFKWKDRIKSISYRVWNEEKNVLSKRLPSGKSGIFFKLKRTFLKVSGAYITPREKETLLDFRKSNNIAFYGYKFKKYQGNAVVIRSKDNKYFNHPDERKGTGWEKVIKGDIKYHVLMGNHKTIMMEPLIRNVADIIGKTLNEKTK